MQTGPADVLAVRVVEPQESQDGVNQPQSRHKPQRRLRMKRDAYSHVSKKTLNRHMVKDNDAESTQEVCEIPVFYYSVTE